MVGPVVVVALPVVIMSMAVVAMTGGRVVMTVTVAMGRAVIIVPVTVVVMAMRGQGVAARRAGGGGNHRVHIAGVMSVVIRLVDTVVLHRAELAATLVAGAASAGAAGHDDQQNQGQQGQGAADQVLAGDLADDRKGGLGHPGEGQGLQRRELEGRELEALGA